MGVRIHFCPFLHSSNVALKIIQKVFTPYASNMVYLISVEHWEFSKKRWKRWSFFGLESVALLHYNKTKWQHDRVLQYTLSFLPTIGA